MEAAVASPWSSLPAIAGVNVYRYLPSGAISVPAIVYAPDRSWIERRTSYKSWAENYLAVCVVSESAGQDSVQQLYDMALALKAAIDSDRAMASWEWRGAGGIVQIEQAGLRYLGSAVRLSFSAEY